MAVTSCKNSAPVSQGDFIINNRDLIFKKAEQGDPYYQGMLAGMYLDSVVMYIKTNVNEAYKWAKKSADSNHPFGLYNLAEMYNEGIVVSKDTDKAKDLYLEAYPGLSDLAESGDQIAQYYLSDLLISGKGVIENRDAGLAWRQKAAEQGNAAAQLFLGLDFTITLFRKPQLDEYNQGMDLLHKAADQGIFLAHLYLGEFYANPQADGVSPNYDEAIKWYRKTAENKYAPAELISDIADIFYNGENIPQNYSEAAKWYQKAADQGHAEAQVMLGSMYEKGEGVQQSFDEAFRLYSKAAEGGNNKAQFELAMLYYYGNGVEQNYSKTITWLTKSADSGYADAQAHLGSMYYGGVGTKRDYKKAVELAQKSADQGNAKAQNDLGYMYEYGLGVNRNIDKAFELYELAGDNGYEIGYWNIGMMYHMGRSVARDYKKAEKWIRKAADEGLIVAIDFLARSGDVEAQYKLGLSYYHGNNEGVNDIKQNFTKALDWFNKAAEKGNTDAMYSLGQMYENGDGVNQDYTIAAAWYKKAAEKGNDMAKKALNNLPNSTKNKNGVDVEVEKIQELSGKNWHLEPLIPGEWYEIRDKEANITIDKLYSTLSNNNKEIVSNINKLRAFKLPFYSSTILYEGEILDDEGTVSIVNFVEHKNGVSLINGQSTIIHELNKSEPLLINTTDDAKLYLKFFCAAIQSKEGSFLIVEKVSDVNWSSKATEKDKEIVQSRIKPLTLKKNSDGTWEGEGTMTYSNLLYSARFKINTDGTIEMIDDTAQVKDIPLNKIVFKGPIRMEEKSKVQELSKYSKLQQDLLGETYEETRDNVLKYIEESKTQIAEEEKQIQERKKQILEEKEQIQKEKKVIESNIAIAEEIKKIEDKYASQSKLPDDITIIELCERYTTEIGLGGESIRCLERFLAIQKQRQ